MSTFTFTVTIPYWLPGSGAVALYLIMGLLTVIYCAAKTLNNKKRGFTPATIKAGWAEGIVGTFAVMLLWPLAFFLHSNKKGKWQ